MQAAGALQQSDQASLKKYRRKYTKNIIRKQR